MRATTFFYAAAAILGALADEGCEICDEGMPPSMPETPVCDDCDMPSPMPTNPSGPRPTVSTLYYNSTTTVTEVVQTLTTWCSEPTVLTVNSKWYTVTEPTTLIITDCPCTMTRVSHPSIPWEGREREEGRKGTRRAMKLTQACSTEGPHTQHDHHPSEHRLDRAQAAHGHCARRWCRCWPRGHRWHRCRPRCPAHGHCCSVAGYPSFTSPSGPFHSLFLFLSDNIRGEAFVLMMMMMITMIICCHHMSCLSLWKLDYHETYSWIPLPGA